MVVGVVVMDVEGPEVVEEEAVDVGERRRLVLDVLVRGGGAIAVHVHRRGSREPAGGEEARTGDVRRNGWAGDVHRRDLLERPAQVELQGFAQPGSLPLIFHFHHSV